MYLHGEYFVFEKTGVWNDWNAKKEKKIESKIASPI